MDWIDGGDGVLPYSEASDCLDENMKMIHSFACSSTYDLRQACLKKRKKKIIKNLPVKNSKL